MIRFQKVGSRASTLQSRPSSRMETLLSDFAKSMDGKLTEIVQSHKSTGDTLTELTLSQRSTEGKLSDMAYKLIDLGQIAEMSDLVERITMAERSVQGSLVLTKPNSKS